MDDHIQRLIEEAKRTGNTVAVRYTCTETRRHQDGVTHRTSANMFDQDGMAIETNDKGFNFEKFFYDHLSAVTGQDALLVHEYRLTAGQKRGYTQRFGVDVKYSPLEKKAGAAPVFELGGEKKEAHFDFVVKSLNTINGTTYSVERVQPEQK